MATYAPPAYATMGLEPVPALIADVASAQGLKQAIHVVAELLGRSPRWVRAVRHREPVCITEDDEITALRARLALARERAAALRGELAALEAMAGDHAATDLEAGGVQLPRNRGLVP